MTTRQVLVRIIRGNCISFTEEVTLNERNRITIHNHPMDSIIDEGEDGKSFEEIYRDVEEVIFTQKKHLISHRSDRRVELVIIIAKPREDN
jgi:hypothetical protein